MGSACADFNEQNIVTVDDGRQTVVFKQIAGLIARRIMFTKRVGDSVGRGERVGMIKFGSRCDVIFDAGVSVQVKVGQHVSGGSSILALAPVTAPAPGKDELIGAEREKGGDDSGTASPCRRSPAAFPPLPQGTKIASGSTLGRCTVPYCTAGSKTGLISASTRDSGSSERLP